MQPVERWGIAEVRLTGPASGDAGLVADFDDGAGTVRVAGFHDGGGEYVVRFSPPREGRWTYLTSSDAAELDGRTGEFGCTPPGPGNHGPASVAHRFHFAYADGTPYRPVGTTVYNLLQQSDEAIAETLDAVRSAGFTKLRLLVFPQGGDHVAPDAVRFPFERDADGAWAVDRPHPGFFRRLDAVVAALCDAGIVADVILFHPYDRGQYGLDGMSEAADAAYVRYVVARLAAYRNVWWSLANEYDQLERPDSRWDRIFQLLRDADPYGRPRSIHNWIELYDHNKPWVTHASLQNGSAVSEFGRATLYRDVYSKPIVLDEIKYEGDAVERWGNLSAQELVHRFWVATVSGVYAGHGESFLMEDGSYSIVKGGPYRGASPPRLAFLRGVLEGIPGAGVDPIDKWDDPDHVAGIPGLFYLAYLGRASPGAWEFRLPQGVLGRRLAPGDRFTVEVIDTWDMTVDPVEGVFTLTDVARNRASADRPPVTLPAGRPLALRIRRAE